MSRRSAGATPLPCARVRRSRCSVSKVRRSPCRKLRPNERSETCLTGADMNRNKSLPELAEIHRCGKQWQTVASQASMSTTLPQEKTRVLSQRLDSTGLSLRRGQCLYRQSCPTATQAYIFDSSTPVGADKRPGTKTLVTAPADCANREDHLTLAYTGWPPRCCGLTAL
ncbi:hypothetical protein AAFF_G00438740 [Aldrovandia affinis]|uniref:Uncharacterized protein n=1 Tax=Aldrovandia affinis TaxID=143900 RepID=A0AAD7R2S2_9TELE|nr:hypothetical protein AAFF_G00438740 [Aldrovandia affinis]